MHEWALAEAIITAAAEVAEKEKLREVTEIIIRVGELQQIEPDILEFALCQLKPAKLKNAKFTIEPSKTQLTCKACGNTWLFTKEKIDQESAEAMHFLPEVVHVFIKCPKCGSPDFEIVEGRGIWLQTVKGVR
jgi:hydrogenase nickel incorporation protein HypA/HybF